MRLMFVVNGALAYNIECLTQVSLVSLESLVSLVSLAGLLCLMLVFAILFA
jgi:hypothetical protein